MTNIIGAAVNVGVGLGVLKMAHEMTEFDDDDYKKNRRCSYGKKKRDFRRL